MYLKKAVERPNWSKERSVEVYIRLSTIKGTVMYLGFTQRNKRQIFDQAILVLEGRVINFLRNAAKHCKKNRHDKLYRKAKERMRKHKERFAELELQLDSAHTEIDGRLVAPHGRES